MPNGQSGSTLVDDDLSTAERLPIDSSANLLSTDTIAVASGPRSPQRSFPSSTTFTNKGPADYLFVSNVRFLAMIAIVWVHTEFFWGYAADHTTAAYLQVFFLQLMKFGTIGFFLISGFLLGNGMTRSSPLKYFRRRVKAVFVPWAFWGLVWFVLALSSHLLSTSGGQAWEAATLHEVIQGYFEFIFIRSIYWFVPNFFICLALVLWLYKRAPNYVQGTVFLIFSLFYGINTYWQVIPSRHTSALFGFVFYLWLGSFAYMYRERFTCWLDRISWRRLASYACVAAMLGMVETHFLNRMNADGSNSLRISNQVYAVLVALLIVKYKGRLYPRSLNVRAETFGIFLLHPILLEVSALVTRNISVETKLQVQANGPLVIGLGVLSFISIYLCAVLLTKLIRSVPRLSWTVGK